MLMGFPLNLSRQSSRAVTAIMSTHTVMSLAGERGLKRLDKTSAILSTHTVMSLAGESESERLDDDDKADDDTREQEHRRSELKH
jgi:hypothetical protein